MKLQKRSYRSYGGKKPSAAPFALAAALAVAALLIELFVNAGIRFIALPLLAAAVVCAVYGLSLRCGPGTGKVIRVTLAAVICAALVFFAVLEGLIIAGSRTEMNGQPQVVVVGSSRPWPPETTTGSSGRSARYSAAASSRSRSRTPGPLCFTWAPSTTTTWG